MTALGDRFWSKVQKADTCWIWGAGRTKDGYGKFLLEGKQQYAHRLSYAATNGTIPQGLNIDHVCHNRACVKPSHLRAVTQKQNCEHRDQARSKSTSGVRGVSRYRGEKWQAHVTHLGKTIHVGVFDDLNDAETAVIAKRNELFTHNDLDRVAS